MGRKGKRLRPIGRFMTPCLCTNNLWSVLVCNMMPFCVVNQEKKKKFLTVCFLQKSSLLLFGLWQLCSGTLSKKRKLNTGAIHQRVFFTETDSNRAQWQTHTDPHVMHWKVGWCSFFWISLPVHACTRCTKSCSFVSLYIPSHQNWGCRPCKQTQFGCRSPHLTLHYHYFYNTPPPKPQTSV